MGRARTRALVALAALVAALALAVPAQASTLYSGTVTVAKAAKQNCTSRTLSSHRGYTTRSLGAVGSGWVTAKLRARSGDWDLGIFDAATGKMVVGSAQYGASETGQGFAFKGERLLLQACRRSGGARTARVNITSEALQGTAKAEKVSLVRVSTATRERKNELNRTGLDLTEHGGKGFVEVLLHGAADAARLRKGNFTYVTQVADLVASDRKARLADQAQARKAHASSLPSGRTGTYRRLTDYQNEMKSLVARNPNLVKPITLPFKTLTGMSVQGIEITENVKQRDGKPVFVNMGIHHAREWPSGENAMEWAYELVNGYKRADSRTRRLMKATRTIVIPIVNPEGFNVSREQGEINGAGGGRLGADTIETGQQLIYREYQRKNCRVNQQNGPDPDRGDCNQPVSTGIAQFGVDPNRNYGGFWGGPGAAADGEAPPGGDLAADYRGNGPFSEPETKNIRDLVAKHQVVTLITNHTFSNLLLRPPGIQVQGPPPDEALYKTLGDSMARENAYTSEPSYNLYDTTGGTEDWTYYATGGLGYTFEIGLIGFHPPYAATIDEYQGTSAEAKAIGGKGNREAYYKALESTALAGRHSVVTGKAPPDAVLRLKKNFKTSTSPVIDGDGVEGKPILFNDELNTIMDVPSSGRYRWNINPSTRPIVAKASGRAAHGTPSPPINQSETAPPGAPCGAADDSLPACYRDFGFTVPAGANIDNGKATVDVEWVSAATDYDITVFFDSNGDGSSDGETQSVGSSAQGTTNNESVTFGEPGEAIAGKKYVVRVVNYAGVDPYTIRVTFGGPPPPQPAKTEDWKMTCESRKGKVGERRSVVVARGGSKTVNMEACLQLVRTCVSTKGGIRSTRVGAARLARTRKKQRATLFGTRFSDRKGIDRYCVAGGGTLRAGYPTARLSSKLKRKTRRRIKSKAVLLLSTSKKFKIKKIRRGSKVSTLRKRLRGERSVKIGRNRWYYAKGKKSKLLFRTRKGKVLEVGIASKSLTKSRRSTVRLLRAWDKRGKRL